MRHDGRPRGESVAVRSDHLADQFDASDPRKRFDDAGLAGNGKAVLVVHARKTSANDKLTSRKVGEAHFFENGTYSLAISVAAQSHEAFGNGLTLFAHEADLTISRFLVTPRIPLFETRLRNTETLRDHPVLFDGVELCGNWAMTQLFSNHYLRSLSSEERELVERTSVIARDRIGPLAAEVAKRDVFARETFDVLAGAGILATAFPRAYGGSDVRQSVRVRLIEELGKVCSAAASMVTGTDLSARAIVAGASDAMKRDLLPRLASGEIQSVFGLTEPGAGSDVRGLAATATRTQQGYRLDGTKKFITRATTADWILAVARLAGEGGAAGADKPKFMALLVPRDAPGVTVGPEVAKLGWYGVPIADIGFRDVRVPFEHRVGEEGQGFALAQDALLRARIGHAAMALGRAMGAVEIASAYVVERQSFGQALGEHQGVQWMIAEMATRIEAARALVAAAADKYERGDADTATFASMAKLHATDLGMQVTTDCLQLAGGRGYLSDFPLERMFRDAKLNQIGEGASEIHKTIIGRELMRRAKLVDSHPCLRPGPLGAY